MKFTCARQAIKWAEETASRPNIQSQIGGLTTVSGGLAGKISRLDMALTITSQISACNPPVPAALRCIFGLTSKDREIELASVMAELISNGYQHTKPQKQIIGMCHAMILQKRKRELFDKRFAIKRMAKLTGVSRHQFCTGSHWIVLRDISASMINNFVENGVSDIDQWLSEVDWVY